MPIFLICTKFWIVVKSFLNKQNKKFVHATWNILSEKKEAINVKFLLNSDFCYLFSRSKKPSADVENWHFQTRITLVSNWN